MLTLTNFLTVTGTAAITTTLGALVKAFWKTMPEPWSTWMLGEVVVFVGGVLQGPITAREGLLLFVSGMVVAATALGSQTGVTKALGKA